MSFTEQNKAPSSDPSWNLHSFVKDNAGTVSALFNVSREEATARILKDWHLHARLKEHVSPLNVLGGLLLVSGGGLTGITAVSFLLGSATATTAAPLMAFGFMAFNLAAPLVNGLKIAHGGLQALQDAYEDQFEFKKGLNPDAKGYKGIYLETLDRLERSARPKWEPPKPGVYKRLKM